MPKAHYTNPRSSVSRIACFVWPASPTHYALRLVLQCPTPTPKAHYTNPRSSVSRIACFVWPASPTHYALRKSCTVERNLVLVPTTAGAVRNTNELGRRG